MATRFPDYTLLDHTADLGMEIYGADLRSLFEAAGNAMMHLMVRGENYGKSTAMKIVISGDDLADLMVRWLGEILYVFGGEKLVVSSIHISTLNSRHLEASLDTVPFDPQVHEILREIKAVTYHQIEVAQQANRWKARVIFDI